MKPLEFGSFIFDPVHLRLSQHGRPCALRHKTACLLRLLLERRGRVVSKREILAVVWHGRLASDQSLFQAVSELRKVLGADSDAILTHPNLGYEWVAGVRVVPADAPRDGGRRRPRLAVAAVAAGLVLAAGLLSVALDSGLRSRSDDGSGPVVEAVAVVPPAMAAFQRGLARLGHGRAAEAERLFAIAMRENPGFPEAGLMLAEAVLAQGRPAEAQAHASQLLLAAQAGGKREAYLAVAAMDLLSRISEQAGHTDQAIGWSRSALAEAREHDFSCTAARNSDRLEELILAAGELAERGSSAPPRADEPSPASARLAVVDAPEPHCLEIGDGTEPVPFDQPSSLLAGRPADCRLRALLLVERALA